MNYSLKFYFFSGDAQQFLWIYQRLRACQGQGKLIGHQH